MDYFQVLEMKLTFKLNTWFAIFLVFVNEVDCGKEKNNENVQKMDLLLLLSVIT